MISRVVDMLVARGFEPDVARSRADLVACAMGACAEGCGGAPRWSWWVPGRLEVLGKHTDYAGGRSLVAAVPRGFAVAAAPRTDDIVRVIDARNGGQAVVHGRRPDMPVRGWGQYVAATVWRLARNFPGAVLGADLAVASDLPRAAGLSSSSALVVAVASALIRRARLDEQEEWQRAIRDPLDLAGYLSCIENGRTFHGLTGDAGVGTEGGSEDHTAILTARPRTLSQFRFVPPEHVGDVRMPDSWRFVVASSGVRAAKAGAVRDRYNRASRAALALLEAWQVATGRQATSLAAALASEADAAAHLRSVVATRPPDEFAPADLTARLDHFLREDGRVPEAAAAFAAADAGALGELSRASQADAEALLRNQVPETIALAAIARSSGALAASSFGAGFGGSVWSVVPRDDARAFGRRWVAAYRARCPHVAGVEWFVAVPAPSVVDLTEG